MTSEEDPHFERVEPSTLPLGFKPYWRCKACGLDVPDRKGAKTKHRSSALCRVTAERLRQERLGNVLCAKRLKLVREYASLVPTKLDRDGRNEVRGVRSQWWCPAWAYIIASADAAPSGGGFQGFNRHERTKLLRLAQDDVELQEALTYAHGQKLDPMPILKAYAREKDVREVMDTDS